MLVVLIKFYIPIINPMMFCNLTLSSKYLFYKIKINYIIDNFCQANKPRTIPVIFVIYENLSFFIFFLFFSRHPLFSRYKNIHF